MEDWRPIVEFPAYNVSDQGRVANSKTGRIMKLIENQKTILYVGLFDGERQHNRTVSKLVADAYLAAPPLRTFDSIINLDADRHNNFAENLMWRPRWFALRYHSQFIHRAGPGKPVADMETGEQYMNVWEAAMTHGLLVNDIVQSMQNQTIVWPTHQRFWRP